MCVRRKANMWTQPKADKKGLGEGCVVKLHSAELF